MAPGGGVNSVILCFNTGTNVTFIKKYAQKFFGYTPTEIIGKNLVGTIVPALDSTPRRHRGALPAMKRRSG